MKTIIATCALSLTGCASLQKLPPITASQVDYRRSDPFGGSSIHAEGVEVDFATNLVKAKTAVFTTQYPFISFSLSVKDYVQEASK